MQVRRNVASVAVAAAVALVLAGCNPSGTDPDWNGGATRTLSVTASPATEVLATAPTPSGKVWVLAAQTRSSRADLTSQVLVLARLKATGGYDTSFGTGGLVELAGHSLSQTSTTVLLPSDDGRVAVATSTTNPFENQASYRISRFAATGSPDTTWGAGGVVTGAGYASLTWKQYQFAVDASGGIVVSSPFGDLTRLTPTGSPDAGFAANGATKVGEVGRAGSTLVGALLSGGGTVTISPTGVLGAPVVLPGASATSLRLDPASGGQLVATSIDGSDVLVRRLTSAGAVDTGFGTAGLATVAIPSGFGLGRATVDAAGGVVLAFGGPGSTTGTASLVLRRLAPGGTPDATYGTAGELRLDGTSGALPPGRSAGAHTDTYGVTVATNSVGRFGAGITVGTLANGAGNQSVTAYDPSGHPLSAFGTAGSDTLDESVPGALRPAGVLVQPDGKVLVGLDLGGSRFQVARYTTAGTLDTTFGTAGLTAPIRSYGTGIRNQLVAAPGGRLVAVSTFEGSLKLTRYQANGEVDTGWATGGSLVVSDLPPNGFTDVAVGAAADGTLAVGFSASGDDDLSIKVVRVSAAGAATRQRTLAPATAGDETGVQGVAFGPSGTILVASRECTPSYACALRIHRLLPALGTDPAFGGGASAVVPLADPVTTALLVAPGGKPVVVADSMLGGTRRPTVARLTATGGVDTSFGLGDGVAEGPAVPDGPRQLVFGGAVDTDGGILVAGYAGVGSAPFGGAGDQGTLTRYTPAGVPDTGFDTDGVRSWPATDVAVWRAVAVGADGHIALAGQRSDFVATVLRLTGTPPA